MPKGIYQRTEAHKMAISKARRGLPSPKKGKRGKKHTEETKRKMSISHLGLNTWTKGRKVSEETRKKMSEYNKRTGRKPPVMRGVDNPNWKGGITPINNKIRATLEYKLWEDSVFNRDCNCCQKCGESRVYKLVAHHILNFSHYIELRFAIDNGITFCKKCHKEFHLKYTTKNNNKKQLVEFLNI